LNQI
jgi:hypothetical protein